MDDGQFRAPQPIERRVPSRQQAAPRRVEKPQPIKEVLEPSYRSDRAEVPPFDKSRKRRPFKRTFLPIIIFVIILAIGLFGWSMFAGKGPSTATAIDSGKYQAVFFTNGQVYFGKLQSFNDQYLKLTDIFYLQAQSTDSTKDTNPQSTSSDQNNVQLIKLGNEVHGPEDQMVISKDQVLFFENLKPDGKVAQSIGKYKAN